MEGWATRDLRSEGKQEEVCLTGNCTRAVTCGLLDRLMQQAYQ
jgi:hypothetical protein